MVRLQGAVLAAEQALVQQLHLKPGVLLAVERGSRQDVRVVLGRHVVYVYLGGLGLVRWFVPQQERPVRRVRHAAVHAEVGRLAMAGALHTLPSATAVAHAPRRHGGVTHLAGVPREAAAQPFAVAESVLARGHAARPLCVLGQGEARAAPQGLGVGTLRALHLTALIVRVLIQRLASHLGLRQVLERALLHLHGVAVAVLEAVLGQ
mmetsp:Transcript_28572/g.54574  ORF Transcript_28572/g.54574 Transcript_28572/m.54574 type:complete len:207 (-) Transcript_28572:336-956(-)